MSTPVSTALQARGQVLVDEVNPAGERIVLTAVQVQSGRGGRVLDASLQLTCGDRVLYEGPDTPASASQWQPALEAARAATAPAAGRSGDDGGTGDDVVAKPRKRKGAH